MNISWLDQTMKVGLLLHEWIPLHVALSYFTWWPLQKWEMAPFLFLCHARCSCFHVWCLVYLLYDQKLAVMSMQSCSLHISCFAFSLSFVMFLLLSVTLLFLLLSVMLMVIALVIWSWFWCRCSQAAFAFYFLPFSLIWCVLTSLCNVSGHCLYDLKLTVMLMQSRSLYIPISCHSISFEKYLLLSVMLSFIL